MASCVNSLVSGVKHCFGWEASQPLNKKECIKGAVITLLAAVAISAAIAGILGLAGVGVMMNPLAIGLLVGGTLLLGGVAAFQWCRGHNQHQNIRSELLGNTATIQTGTLEEAPPT